jgi:branched-chain amino acid aminotransferase/4-amino-4-deoxychorismate lyase
MIAPDDRGFTLGHGLFETILWSGGGLRHWPAHMARLTKGCEALGMPAPDAEACEREARGALAALPDGTMRAAVRINWSAGPGARGLDMPAVPQPALSATAAPAPASRGSVRLHTSTIRRNDTSPASRLKTLAYLDNVLARGEARAAGADEALMLNTAGQIACAAAANVFWIKGGVIQTPRLDCGVLDGITRGRVLEACSERGWAVVEVRVGIEKLRGCEGLFLTNSLQGVRPVSVLDGEPIAQSPLVETLAALVANG